MLKVPTPVRRTALLLFLGVSLCYMSMAPGTVGGRGYVNEELDSGSRMLEIFNTWIKGRPVPPMLWARHGPIPILFDLPFIKLGKLLISPDFGMSLEPVLVTALLVTLLFLWLRKLCSPGMSLLLSLTAAFGTMFWPYAYLGMETKQSLFVMLAGYLGLAVGKIRGWPRVLLFAVVCGLALTMKATGIVMWPAFAYLIYVQFRDDWRSRLPQLLVTAGIVAGFLAVGWWSQHFYWDASGGGVNNIRPWMIKSPFQLFTNTIGMFGSPSKGLLIYAPVLIVSLFSLARAFRAHRDVVVFASTVITCTVGFLSLLTYGSDEVWGPRYMHLAIAPLTLCIGAAWPRFHWLRHAPVVLLSIIGVVISFLGAFYYYGILDFAMKESGQNTMEWINGDPVWNDIMFNARLFALWMEGGDAPVVWTPAHLWVWEPPAGAAPWGTVNLRPYSNPQAALLNLWKGPIDGPSLTLFRLFFVSLLAGPLLLIWTVLRTFKEGRNRALSKLWERTAMG